MHLSLSCACLLFVLATSVDAANAIIPDNAAKHTPEQQARCYADRYEDLREVFCPSYYHCRLNSLKTHFETYGRSAGRIYGCVPVASVFKPEPLASKATKLSAECCYVNRYEDLREIFCSSDGSCNAMGINEHFELYGRREGRLYGCDVTGLCALGVLSMNAHNHTRACCAASCGEQQCEMETSCSELPGRANQCCAMKIMANAVPCVRANDTGCVALATEEGSAPSERRLRGRLSNSAHAHANLGRLRGRLSPLTISQSAHVMGICGKRWAGLPTVRSAPLLRGRVHVVMSHCNTDFDYLAKFLGDVQPATTTIISKCGVDPSPLPAGATVLRWPNVGGCDHSYAAWIATSYSDSMIADDDIVFFLKDTRIIHQGNLFKFQTMPAMLAAVSDTGFACGIADPRQKRTISAYSRSEILGKYHMTNYKETIFRHDLTLAEWWASLEIKQPPVVQMCYGGWFASTGARLKSRDSTFWAAMAQSLDYGEYNIPEGHYAERSWASLLREPISDALIAELDAHASIMDCHKGGTGGRSNGKAVLLRNVSQNSEPLSCGAYVNCGAHEQCGAQP